jgi:hypothetical protein
MKFCSGEIFIKSYKTKNTYIYTGVFLRRNAVPEALSQKDASRNGVPEPFYPGIGITRLGVSCYPTALLSNKLA